MREDPTLFFNAIEHASQAAFLLDANSRVIFQNHRAQQLFGFSDDELNGSLLTEKLRCQEFDGEINQESGDGRVCVVARNDGSRLRARCRLVPLYMERKKQGMIFFAEEEQLAQPIVKAASDPLAVASDVAKVALFDYCPQAGRLSSTASLNALLGLPKEMAVSWDTIFAVVHPDDIERVRQTLRDAETGKNEGNYETEYRIISLSSGELRWLTLRGQLIKSDGIRHLGAVIDITERKLAEEAARQAAYHCTLTGLPTRALLEEYTEHIFAMAERDGARSAVLFIDLDRFKPINDLYGHEAGDKVLQEVARRLRAVTRKEDIVSRLGGDEFVVVLPHVDSNSDPWTVARYILQMIEQPIDAGQVRVSISASIGISLFPKHGKNLETLIRCADVAMYNAKRQGRKSVQTYVTGSDAQINGQLQIEMRLKEAVESNQLILFYQPIIDMQSGSLNGVEALLRMTGKNGDLITPDKFIPIAESSGLIQRIGQWVTIEACRQHQAWLAAGLPPLSVAVNVSAVEFKQRDLVRHLSQAIKETGIDPAYLQVEVTEGAVMENVDDAIDTLNQIRSMGIRIALDDFGTGYSSLSYLSSLPLDKLKIDQSFIRRLDSNQSSKLITETIIGLGHLMNLQVVGEGIESEKAKEYLREQGCNQAQGFLYSKPLPPHEFESWYRSRSSSLH